MPPTCVFSCQMDTSSLKCPQALQLRLCTPEHFFPDISMPYFCFLTIKGLTVYSFVQTKKMNLISDFIYSILMNKNSSPFNSNFSISYYLSLLILIVTTLGSPLGYYSSILAQVYLLPALPVVNPLSTVLPS